MITAKVANRAVRGGVGALGLSAVAGLAGPAWGQLGPNIESQLRPLVTVQFPNAPTVGARTRTFLGLFDTGNDNISISPQVNSLLGIGVLNTYGAAAGRDRRNDNIVGNAIDLRLGGFLGPALNGPEDNPGGATDRTKRLTSEANLNAANPTQRPGFQPSLTYFGAVASTVNMLNIGTAFVTQRGNAGAAGFDAGRVAMVDPIHAYAAPFNFSNNDAMANPGLTVLAGALNNRSSSVSFFAPDSIEVPTPTLNANPGFLTFMPFDAPPAGGYRIQRQDPTGAADPNGTDRGPAPTVTITATQATLFTRARGAAVAAGTYTPDTGAPTTGGVGGLMGTDVLNRFGQYWDYTSNRPGVMLFGPSLQGDRDMLSVGMLMTVDQSARGAARTGVQQMREFGRPASMNFEAAVDAADLAQNSANSQGISIYRTHGTHSNAAYIDGRAALGLTPGGATPPGRPQVGDQIDGLSMGGDKIGATGQAAGSGPLRQVSLFFSVDAASRGNAAGDGPGFAGGGVNAQANLNQVAGDVFMSSSARPANAAVGRNVLRLNQDVIGLQGNVGPFQDATGRGNHDNLRDFDINPEQGMRDSTRVLRNVDPTIRTQGDVRNPLGNAATGGLAARTDVLNGNMWSYYSLQNRSTTLANVASGADIYSQDSSNGTPRKFAGWQDLGLVSDDDVDALALTRATGRIGGQDLILPANAGPRPGNVNMMTSLIDSRFDENADESFGRISFPDGSGAIGNDVLLFSLAPGSPSLALMSAFLGRQLSAADVFVSDLDGTFTLYASAESLGLLAGDNIDGLDITAIPAPGSAILLAAAGAAALRRRRREC